MLVGRIDATTQAEAAWKPVPRIPGGIAVRLPDRRTDPKSARSPRAHWWDYEWRTAAHAGCHDVRIRGRALPPERLVVRQLRARSTPSSTATSRSGFRRRFSAIRDRLADAIYRGVAALRGPVPLQQGSRGRASRSGSRRRATRRRIPRFSTLSPSSSSRRGAPHSESRRVGPRARPRQGQSRRGRDRGGGRRPPRVVPEAGVLCEREQLLRPPLPEVLLGLELSAPRGRQEEVRSGRVSSSSTTASAARTGARTASHGIPSLRSAAGSRARFLYLLKSKVR